MNYKKQSYDNLLQASSNKNKPLETKLEGVVLLTTM